VPRLLLYRAEIAARRGQASVAWLSLHALGERAQNAARGVAERGLALARQLGPPPSPVFVAKLEAAAHGRAAALPREEAAAH